MLDTIIRIIGIAMIVALLLAIFSLSSLRSILRENGITLNYFDNSYIFNKKKLDDICKQIRSTKSRKDINNLRKAYIVSISFMFLALIVSFTFTFIN